MPRGSYVRVVLYPLAGHTKDDILRLLGDLGELDVSALADGPVSAVVNRGHLLLLGTVAKVEMR